MTVLIFRPSFEAAKINTLHNEDDMNETLNFLKARSTWLFFLTIVVQFGSAFGFDLSFDAANDPDKFADAVSVLLGLWATIERITGVKKLVKPWQGKPPLPAVAIARRSRNHG